MKYYNNILKPKTSAVKKYKIASFDIETYNRHHNGRNYTEFLIGGFIDDKGVYKRFTEQKAMIKYIEEHTDKDTIVFATNNMFDYQGLFSKQEDYKKFNPLMRGGRIIAGNYHGIKMYDTINYVAKGVKELGKMLGIQKGDFDVKNTQPLIYYKTHKTEFERLRVYNYYDCKITREFMIQFQDVLNKLGGQLQMTIGSCALDLYRRKYLRQNIHKEYCIDREFSDGETAKEFIFRGYRGGRSETFRRGDTDYRILKDIKNHKKIRSYYYYDFNSMYMECMKGEFPLPSSGVMRENRDGYLSIDNIKNYMGVSECEVIVPYMHIPILPMTINHKLCFPIGRFRGVFTHGELQEHLSNGGQISGIFKTIYYTKKFIPFEKWVVSIYGHRMKAQKQMNNIYDTIFKNIGVNLYGKFGTHKLSKFEMIDIDSCDDITGVQINDDDMDFTYRETPVDCSQCYIFPIFASHVTMKGRLKLWKELIRLNAIQCDTDSIFTDKYVKPSEKLGRLKLEDEIIKLCPTKTKWYKYFSKRKNKWIYKLKGLQLGKGDMTTDEEYRRAVAGQKVSQWKFLKMKESLRGGGEPNERIDFTKTFNSNDDKRIWIPDKYDENMYQESEPIILGFKNIDDLNSFFL